MSKVLNQIVIRQFAQLILFKSDTKHSLFATRFRLDEVRNYDIHTVAH